MEQRSARQAHNLKAAGSNPAFATIEVIKLFFMDQIVRHILKEKDASRVIRERL